MRHGVFLEVSSWQGVSIGAEHYYGKLVRYSPYHTVELEYRLTEKQAAEFSKKDDWKYKAGDKCSRFDTVDEVVKLGIAQYKDFFPDAKILFTGESSTSAEPSKMIDGDPDLMKLANEIWQKYEAIPWERRGAFYDRSPENRKIVNRLTDEWNALFDNWKHK